jgi:hypothetical protein
MNRILTAAATLGLALLAACEVNVDQNLQSKIENGAENLGNTLESAAGDAGNTLGAAGDVIANGANDIGNRVDVNVDLSRDGNGAVAANASTANSQ